jgi:drug/metabolite transporter (DMT)-like permease
MAATVGSGWRAVRAPTGARRGPPIVLTWADGGALLAVLLWGISFPVMKALMTVVDPVTLVVVLWLIALAILGAVLGLRGAWRWPAGSEWPQIAAVGLVGFTLNQMLYARGLHLTTASHAGLIFTVTPLVVFGLSWALGQVHVRRLDLAGLGLGMGGAALIIGWPDPGAAGASPMLGDLLMIGAAITWGVWTVLAAPVLRRRGTLDGTFWISAAGTIGMVPFALPGLLVQEWALPWWAFAGIAYSGVISATLASLLWYAAVRHLGPARTGIYANLESLFAVLASALLLEERVAVTALVGGAAVVAGVLLTRRRG